MKSTIQKQWDAGFRPWLREYRRALAQVVTTLGVPSGTDLLPTGWGWEVSHMWWYNPGASTHDREMPLKDLLRHLRHKGWSGSGWSSRKGPFTFGGGIDIDVDHQVKLHGLITVHSGHKMAVDKWLDELPDSMRPMVLLSKDFKVEYHMPVPPSVKKPEYFRPLPVGGTGITPEVKQPAKTGATKPQKPSQLSLF